MVLCTPLLFDEEGGANAAEYALSSGEVSAPGWPETLAFKVPPCFHLSYIS